MSLFDVFSPRTVEPNKPNWETPTAIRGIFSDVKRFKTDFLFISMIPYEFEYNVREDLLAGSKVASNASKVESFDLRAAESCLGRL